MLEKKIITHSPSETMKLAEMLSSVCEPGDIIILNGNLGAGKTVFVQGFSFGLGIDRNITSPTFTLSKKYVGKKANLVHVDVYRMLEKVSADNLSDLDFLYDNLETLDLDKDENDSIFLIEWGDAIKGYFSQGVLEIEIDRENADSAGGDCIDFADFLSKKECASVDEADENSQDRIIKITSNVDRYNKFFEVIS